MAVIYPIKNLGSQIQIQIRSTPKAYCNIQQVVLRTVPHLNFQGKKFKEARQTAIIQYSAVQRTVLLYLQNSF
jgi:hypothetical protein